MKTRLIPLLVMLCSSVLAGQLKDSANIFGPQARDVEKAITDQPVWIETRVETPPGGLKAYADSEAEKNGRGFYVVITTQPRGWRISMSPVGLASSEGTRLAGEAMAARFKRGQFADGAIVLSRDLVRLSQPKPVTQAAAPIPRQVQAKTPSPDYTWVWIVGGFGLVIVAGVIVMVVVNRRDQRRQEELEERLQREREQRADTQRLEDQRARQRFTQPSPTPAPSQPDRAEAQRVYDSYTPSQRRTIIEERHHHHYSSGASTDPLMFYLLMQAAQPHYAAPVVYEAPRRHSPAPDPEPERSSFSSSDSSSSDSSSSSGGYDSGSSSFDSGSSSSDSSGSSGSW